MNNDPPEPTPILQYAEPMTPGEPFVRSDVEDPFMLGVVISGVVLLMADVEGLGWNLALVAAQAGVLTLFLRFRAERNFLVNTRSRRLLAAIAGIINNSACVAASSYALTMIPTEDSRNHLNLYILAYGLPALVITPIVAFLLTPRLRARSDIEFFEETGV